MLRELHPGKDAAPSPRCAQTDVGHNGPAQARHGVLWEECGEGAEDRVLWLLQECCSKGDGKGVMVEVVVMGSFKGDGKGVMGRKHIQYMYRWKICTCIWSLSLTTCTVISDVHINFWPFVRTHKKATRQ